MDESEAKKTIERDMVRQVCRVCYNLCGQNKCVDDKSFEDVKQKKSIWVILTYFFATISTVLLVSLICLCFVNSNTSSGYCGPKTFADQNKRATEQFTFSRTNGSDVFSELSMMEINDVLQFLYSKKDLNLVPVENASISSNYIHSIEMKLPDKEKVISYLKGEAHKPDRMATVYIFRGADTPPTVDEYVVGGISGVMYCRRIETSRRRTKIPFVYRPFSTTEFMAIFTTIVPKISRLAEKVLMESYDALPMKCDKKCLRISMSPVSSGFLPDGLRKAWFGFLYDLEFSSVRPLDFQFLVDTTSIYPDQWSFESIWYANQTFPNISTFLDAYNYGNITKTRLQFPDPETSTYGSMQFRHPLIPLEPLRAPKQYEPDYSRYKITENEIHYMQWKVNFRVSTTGGLQLLNIRFAGERIAYELSMQEIVVLYSGSNPVFRTMNFADGAGLFGTRYRGLLPGVDCPSHAQFVNTYLYASNEFGGKIFENALCVFEFNLHTPLRRHRAYGRSGAVYGGLEATALVVRGIISVINYDYIIDYLFYQNGIIETKVSMTGFLGSSFFYPKEDDYGTHVHKFVSASLHNHLFNFKVDIDIKGTVNRYETIDIHTRTEQNPWMHGAEQTQAYISKSLKESELQAVHKFNFDTPKLHVFSSHDHVSDLGNPRGYQIQIQKMSKQLLPRGHGFEDSISWSRYQMVVTKYKPDEERSSSIFTMWDARNPVVNFQKYLDDNDSLVDQDLVSWITLGTQHLPHTENLPTTTTIGTQLSFHISPFNYFDEDPSMHSRDSVRITPRDKSKPLNGAVVEQYGALDHFNCVSVNSNHNLNDLLSHNSTFLFS